MFSFHEIQTGQPDFAKLWKPECLHSILHGSHLVLQKIGCSGACGDDPLVFRYCAEQFGLPCVWI